MPTRTLTARQRQVIRLVTLGCTAREVAAILGIEQATVKDTLHRARARLSCEKMPLLVRLAIKHEITTLDDKLTATEKRMSGRKDDGWN